MLKAVYSFFHRHYHRKYFGIYKHAKQLFVFDMGLLALSFIMFGASLYFFLWKPNTSSLIEISISVGNGRIKSGDSVVLTVGYINHSKKTVENPTLAVRLPDGFILDKEKTKNLGDNTTFKLTDLAAGAGGHSEIFGTYWSNLNSEDKIIATISYNEKDRPERDQSYGVMYAKLTDSVLSGELHIATSSLPDQTLAYEYILKNNGTSDLTNIFLERNGALDQTPLNLKAGETKTVTSTTVTPANKIYQFEIRPVVNANNLNFNQKSNQAVVDIFLPKITLKASLTDPRPYVDPGAEVPVKISWKNDSEFPLLKQMIIVTTTEGVVDVAETQKLNRLYTKGQNLVITPKDRTALGSGKPGSEDEFVLTLKLKSNFANKPDEARSLNIQPIFQANVIAANDQTFTSPGNQVEIRLPSEVTLNSEARYYTEEGDQVGRGPLPPTVGKTTKYWVFTTLGNTNNPLRDTVLNFNLAPGVSFTGKQSVTIGPELVYDAKNNRLSWDYRYGVPENTESGIYFEVSVSPTVNQIGQPLTLVKDVTLTAADDIVNKEYALKLENLTNILNRNDEGSTVGALVTLQLP